MKREQSINDLRRATTSLFLEVPKDIARDVQAKAEAVIALEQNAYESGRHDEMERIKLIVITKKNLYALSRGEVPETLTVAYGQILDAIEAT